MPKISLFKVGLVSMLFFVFASNVFNYVSIATRVWDDSFFTSIWDACFARPKCYKENPPGLIGTGTAFNCLSFLLIIVAQAAIFVRQFKDKFAIYFVISSLVTSLLSLLFNAIGWFFVFNLDYQGIPINAGWSFWLMTPSFACTIIAALIGSSILGCTCVANTYKKQPYQQTIYTQNTKQVYQENSKVLRL